MIRQKKKTWWGLPILACFMWLAVSLAFPFSALAIEKDSSARVDDGAGLFTASQADELQKKITALREEMNMDVALLTRDYTEGAVSEEYADRYYENEGYGVGEQHSGVLLFLDMYNRQLYVSTEGAMTRFLTDDRIETMMDNAIPYMQEGDYAGAAGQMLDDVQVFYRKGIVGGQYNYDRETGAVSRHRSIRWYEGLLAAGVAVFCGGSACLAVKKDYAMEQEQRQAANYHMAYRANAQFNYQNQADALIDQSVVQSLIASAVRSGRGPGSFGGGGGGRSTTHTSSGGRSHGGGGRGF